MRIKRVLAFLLFMVMLFTNMIAGVSSMPFGAQTQSLFVAGLALTDDVTATPTSFITTAPTPTQTQDTITAAITVAASSTLSTNMSDTPTTTDSPSETVSPGTSTTPETIASASATPEESPTTTPQPTTYATADVTPTSAPALWGSDAICSVEMNGTPDAEGTTLTCELETLSGMDTWIAVPDPTQPEIIFKSTLTLNSSGNANGSFSLEGFPETAVFRVRVTSCDLSSALSDSTYYFQYSDTQPSATEFATSVSFTVASPAITPTDMPTITPEPSASPVPVYGEDAVYHINVQFESMPADGYQPITFALFADNGGGESFITSTILTPDDNGTIHGQLSLSGYPSQSTYHIVATAYAGSELVFTDNSEVGSSTAESAGLSFVATQGALAYDLSIAPLSLLTPLSPSAPMSLGSFSVEATSASAPYETPLTLTLNLAINGKDPVAFPIGFTITEDAESGTYGCNVTDYNAAIAAVTSSVVGSNVHINVQPIVPDGDATLQYTIVVDPLTLGYTITASASGYDSTLSSDTGVFTNGAANADLSAMALIDYIISINWNDSNSSTRPAPELSLLADGSIMDPQPALASETISYNLDQYTCVNLNKYRAGTAINYAVTQTALANYLTTTTDATITNTLKTTLTVYLQWYDISSSAYTRPSAADCLAGFTLLQQARSTGSTAVELAKANDTFTTTGDLWTYSVSELPAYDPLGYPYDYMIRQGSIVSADASLGEYVSAVKNVGIYAGNSTANTAYNGGTLINTITDTVGFSFTNQWKDAGNVAGRPVIKYYLYRFPLNTGLSFDTLSPVRGLDNMTLADYSTIATVVYVADGTLPRYDTSGNEYVYYIRETMASPGDYVVKIANTDTSVLNYILPNAVVTNVLEATTSVPFTKFWQAKAVQSMTGGIVAQLERKLSTDDDSAWSIVGTKTVTGFRAETMTLSSSFANLNKYDADGALYTYRVTEIGATINAVGDVVPTDNIVGGQFTDGDFTFSVTQPAIGDSSNTITNKLIGTTSLRVKKIWSPSLTDGTTASITILILQNGSVSWDTSAVTYTAGVTHNAGSSYTLTGIGNLDEMFSTLPRYDAEGREYRYTVQETAINEPSDYTLSNIYYATDENSINTATIVNTSGGDGGMSFRINKVWLDDGDLLSRVPIAFGLYHLNGTDTPDLVDTYTLDASDAWTGTLSYTPTGDLDEDYSHYYIREITNTGLSVTMDTDYLATGNGNAQTISQKYQVSTVVSTDNRTYTITNLRVGKLKITVAKTWYVNNLADLELYATFSLYNGGADPIDAKTIIMPDPSTATAPVSIEFGGTYGLEKYDANGVIIPYRVVETSLTDKNGHTDTFINSRISLQTDEFILSSVTPGLYQYGATLDDPDTMSYTFTNRLSGSNALSINVIWRDPGTGVPTRPDIRLSLYRTTDVVSTTNELVATVRLWNTNISDNIWYWVCGFGSYPKFDGNGDRYNYYVKETFLQPSGYAASYYSTVEGVALQPDAAGNTTATTFPYHAEERSDIQYAYANFDESLTGTIINTLTGTLDVERKKIWMNLPGWYNTLYLPTVKFQLYRTLTPLADITQNTVVEAVQKDNADWIETLTNGTTMATFSDASVYNIYGDRYYYFVKELTASGVPFDVDWYTTTSSVIAGTVTNTYNQTSPSVAIKINKSWDFTSCSTDQTKYPATTYDIHQYWSSSGALDGVIHDAIVQTATIPGGSIADLATTPVPSVTVTQNSSGAALPHYAPDGQAYTYYIVERALNGFTVTPSDLRAYPTWDENHTLGEVAFSNSYTPVNQNEIIATKYWNDQNDPYLNPTRPAFNAGNMPLSFTLMRKTASGVNEPVPTALITSSTWSQGTGDNANNWYCAFAGSFPTYSTLGETYTYFIVETIAAAYTSSYTQTAGAGTLTITNSLKLVNVLLAKSWESSDGIPFTAEELTHLKDLGAMPDSVTFTIHQSNDSGTTWDTDLTPIEKTVDWLTLKAYALNGKYLVMASQLPKYVPGTQTEYVYKVEETTVTYGSTTTTPEEAGFTIVTPSPSTSNSVTEIANQLGVRKLYFVKNWVDDNDRDGVRPTKVDYTIKDQVTFVETTVTLSPTSISADPSTDSARIASVNRWRAELTVPTSGTYTVTEALTNVEYAATSGDPVVLQDVSAVDDWWGFTNHREIKLVPINATKTWVGDTDWVSITRPATVTYHLLYKKATDALWTDLSTLSESPDALHSIPVSTDASITLGPGEGQTWADVSAQWSNLPGYAYKANDTVDTQALMYSIAEAATNGYSTTATQTSISGDTASTTAGDNTIAVTNTLVTVSVAGTKHWVDASNKYNCRPTTIALSVYADGAALTPQPTIHWTQTGDAWTYNITNLPRYQMGTLTPIEYSVVETPAIGYLPNTITTATGTVDVETGNVTAADFTNTLITVTIIGTKTWADNTNRYGMRPSSIALTIMDGATALNPQPAIAWVKNTNTWTYTIAGLPRYYAGTTNAVSYTIKETAVGGYSPITDTTVAGTVDSGTGNVSGADFTNTLITISLAGSKTWVDYSNLYSMRPAGITLTVKANGTSLSPQPTATWDKTGDVWAYSFVDIPKYVKGTYTPISYTVVETGVSGYTPTATTVSGTPDAQTGNITGANFTNTLALITLSGQKTWVDQSNVYSRRPDAITLTVLADGVAITPKNGIVWDKSANPWTYSITELPRYRKGTTTAIVYTIKETAVSAYSPITDTTFSGSVNGTTGAITNVNITNTLITVSIAGTKTWVDTQNRYGTRPSSITLTLLADGTPLLPQPTPTWNKPATGTIWTYSYNDLPRYQLDNVTPISYAVVEDASTSYLPVTQTTVIPLTDGNGNATNADFTNTLVTIDVSGSKTWMDDSNHYGMRPDSLTLMVKADGTIMSAQPDVAWVKDGSIWHYTIIGLPRYQTGTTTDIVYSIEEVAAGGYVPNTNTTVFGTVDPDTHAISHADFENTLVVVSLEGSKTWVDDSDLYSMRPENIVLSVNTNSVALDPQPVLAWVKSGDIWHYSCEGLPLYTKGSYSPADYTVTETAVGGYMPMTDTTLSGDTDGAGNITGVDFTNTLATISINGTKTWVDQTNLYSRRPEDITLTVLADTVAITPKNGIVWSKSGNTWMFTVTQLPRYRLGTFTPIQYTLNETTVPAYTSSPGSVFSGTADHATGDITAANITNTLVTVSVSGQKNWLDDSNMFSTRPAGITLTLLADGSPLSPQPTPVWDKVSTANTWTYLYSGLPRYQADHITPILYSVVETPVAGYFPLAEVTTQGTVDSSGNVTDADFTNTLTYITITGTKTWHDDGDRYGSRPSTLALTVYADDIYLSAQPSVSWVQSGDTWSYVIAGLPRYQAGSTVPVAYSVTEAVPDDYVPENTTVFGETDPETGDVTAADFSNTLATISIHGTKHWVDDSDSYRYRPADLDLSVWADSATMSVQPDIVWTKTGDDWIYTIQGLPRYAKGSSTPIDYEVREAAITGYDASTSEGSVDSAGNLSAVDFTNTLTVVTLSGAKYWEDQSNRYSTRPSDLTLTVLADDVELAPQPAIVWDYADDIWSYSITGLPKYRANTTTPIIYSVQETAAAGYTVDDSDSIVFGTVAESRNITDADFTNTLDTVNISGTKVWNDQTNLFGTRPTEVELTVLADGIALVPQPEAVWDQTTDTEAWTYVFSGLPRYQTGSSQPIIYTVHETEVSGYMPADDASGLVDATTGNVTMADFENALVYQLEIDNTTVNAITGKTDAGGFVAINATPSQRDLDPYQDHAMVTQWKAEEFWEITDQFYVSYLPHGPSGSTSWSTVTVSYTDLSALTSIPGFENATLTKSDGTYTLTLGDQYQSMPRQTRVQVSFRPTLAVQNKTENHGGGQVAIVQENTVKDGRYVALVAYGIAKSAYQVDLKHLQLLLPTSETSTTGRTTRPFSLISGALADTTSPSTDGVLIQPDTNGEFTALINEVVGGVSGSLSVSGNIKVLKYDANLNPSSVSVTLYNLPASLDIGIQFTTSSTIPVTGDPLVYVITIFVISGLALLLLRGKRKKENRETKLHNRTEEL